MAGEAKTTQMLLSTATVMIGPSANVMGLDPATHSIGLVKNVQVQTDMGYVDLTQGVNNLVVMSVQTKMDVKVTSEVYEYTAKNLAYAAGLDGSTLTENTTSYTLGAAIANGGTSVTLTDATEFAAGDFVVLQDTTTPDRIAVGKVQSVATDILTLNSEYALPTASNFAVATTNVYKVNGIKVGVNFDQPTFGAKLVGLMPSTGEPVTLVFPKVKITKGANIAFETNNFANMPFEFTPYAPVSTDPFYNDFQGKLYGIYRR